jgi:uncharacterized membrane protein YfcA
MTETRTPLRLAAVLGFVAVVLAESAVVARYLRTGDVDWRIAAAGLFIGALALSAWTRSGVHATDRPDGT